MTERKGIRALVPPFVLPEEEQEMLKARAAVMKKIDAAPNLPAAPTLSSSDISFLSSNLHKPIIEKLPDEVKDEYGFTPSQNREIDAYLSRPDPKIKETPKETWKRLDDNEKRRQKQLLKNWGLDKDPSIKQQVINYSPNKVNKNVYQPKKNFLKKVEIEVDAKHPDGFRLTEDEYLYKYYGKEPLRYVQEIGYKYDGTPITETVKEFDSYDKTTYPSNYTPSQKNHIKMYQNIYDDLTPKQRKQVDFARRSKKKK